LLQDFLQANFFGGGMRRYLTAFFLSFFIVQSVSAQVLSDPAYANMQRTMAGITQNVAKARGFSISDPRVYSTLYGMGTAATAAAATAGAGLLVAGTSPAWGTVLAIAAVSGAISYAVSLGMDGLYKWAFDSPSTTPISVTAPSSAGGQATITPSTTMPTMAVLVAGSIGQPFYTIITSPPYFYSQTWFSTTAYVNPGAGYTLSQNYTLNGIYYYVWATASVSSSTLTCPTGYTVGSNVCNNNSSGGTPVTTALQTLTQAIAALTDAEKATQLNDQTLALMMNYLWQQAASQPGYDGLPYAPVTQADVDTFLATNPASYPTVGSLVTPVSPGCGGFYPAASPTGPVSPDCSPIPPGTINPASSVTPVVNLGPDPVIGSPSLETPPDGPAIMAPILTGLAPYLSFSVLMPAGVCPAPTFDFRPVWNLMVPSTVICTLYDSISQKIFNVMTLAWTVLFLIIVLKA
jgi:hypothetical protein